MLNTPLNDVSFTYILTEIVTVHSLSDFFTTLAYYSIPISLIVFVKKKRNLELKWMFILFILFILLCGTTHLMHIIEYLYPSALVQFIDKTVRALTAIVSIFTAIMLWRMIPKALRIPSPSDLENSNKISNERWLQLEQSNALLKKEITRHKQTTKELHQLTTFMQYSNDAIIGLTSEAKISSWNLGASEIFGYSYEEMLGESYFKLIPSDQQKEMKKIIANIQRGQRLAHYEIKHIQKDGAAIEGSLTISPVRNDESSEIVGISIIVRDITISKKNQDDMERRLDQLNMVGQLAASVAHEIRNPLTVIRGFVQLYSNDIKKRNTDHAKIIINELDRTESIISSYLSLAKPQIGQIDEINIKTTMLEILEMMMSYANYSKINIIHQMESELCVLTDKEKFNQLFINVIKNGIESMPNGGILTINAYRFGDGISIDIIDTGVGMTKKEIIRLGSPFYSTKNKGTGLGTMVMYKTLELFNWKLKVNSIKGEGSQFSFFIP